MRQRGMSLIEVLVAMSVMLFVFLALMQTALISIDANMTNVLRDEGLIVAEAAMNEARNTPFPNLVTTNSVAQRNLRGITNFRFTRTTTVTDLNTENKQVVVSVTWRWKDEDYSQSLSTLRKSGD